MYFVGLDIGTTGTKTIVFDKDGNLLSSVVKEYNCYYPQPDYFEISGREMLDATFYTCRKAIEDSGVDPREIKSFGLSTQRSTFGLLDKEGNIINDILYSWQDNRAVDSIDYILERIPEEEVVSICGMPVKQTYAVTKLIWIKRHQPEIYEKADKFIMISEYLLKLLGADDYFLDTGNAACSGLLDIRAGEWSKKLFDTYELDMGMMPKLVPPAFQVGTVSREGSRLSGLAVGTPVCTGIGDQQCGVIGAGCVRQGVGTMTVGTAGFLISFLDKPALGYKFRSMMSASAGVPGKFEIEGIMLGAAANYKWFRDNFCEREIEIGQQTGQDPFELMEKYVENSSVGSNGVMTLPHLGAAGCPHWNAEASGVIAGITFAHTKADIARSFMEGIIFEIRNMYTTMMQADIVFDEIIATGGAIKSPTWRQIMADIMGCRIKTLKVSDATVLGAAILGAVGAGYFDSVEIAVRQMVHYKDDVMPIKENVEKYNSIFKTYCKLYDALDMQDVFKELRMINKGLF